MYQALQVCYLIFQIPWKRYYDPYFTDKEIKAANNFFDWQEALRENKYSIQSSKGKQGKPARVSSFLRKVNFKQQF